MIKRNFQLLLVVSLLLVSILLQVSCSSIGGSANPADWGYESVVTYHALGGSINTREVRETYYLTNSYVFEPAGTTNMLIKPIRDGYLLAGWYTAKEDILDASGKVVGYRFKTEDRWDFDEDRVQETMTLYARWIEQARVAYVDAASGEVKFLKNVTETSTVQPLSAAAEKLITPAGQTLYGYFADQACSVPYDFSEYEHANLIPDAQTVYNQLAAEFPDYFKKAAYQEPEDKDPEKAESNPDLFVNKLGYQITTADPAARAAIRARKDQIIEDAITNYLENTALKTVYLKYVQGRFIKLSGVESLKKGGVYGFRDADSSGPVDGYILEVDLDFSGLSMEIVESFGGTIFGNGYRLKNIEIKVASRKVDMDAEKQAGMFLSLDQATIQDVVFENFRLNIAVKSGIPVTAGALAAQAAGMTLRNVTFEGLAISTGTGDDGKARYRISDLIWDETNCVFEQVTASGVTIQASGTAEIRSVFGAPR